MNQRERNWDVRRALILMRGTEQAVRLLIADLDRELVDRDSYNKSGPRAIGIAVATTVHAALYCEYAIKTYHSVLSGGKCLKGHLLVARNEHEKGLYDHLEDRYMYVEDASRGDLSGIILSEIRSYEACCPLEWFNDESDVRLVLLPGSANFEDWRYGYPETGQLRGGIPKGLFAVGKGLELLSRRRFFAAQVDDGRGTGG